MVPNATGVYLLWIPLGAGGSGVVRASGRLYERLMAWRHRRPALDLYHTALILRLDDAEHVVETMWPSPAGDPATRGVVVSAPVFADPLGRVRLFRYEVRSWRNGLVLDAAAAVGGPRLVESDPQTIRRLLDLVPSVPALVWGRDQRATGDMWNSNSVISWLLTRIGVGMESIAPPERGRAPGWDAGIAVALTQSAPAG
jgi:hypothetical protein